jgi:hypothetical protein
LQKDGQDLQAEIQEVTLAVQCSLKEAEDRFFKSRFVRAITPYVEVSQESDSFEQKLCAIEIILRSSFEHFFHDFVLVAEKLAIRFPENLCGIEEHLCQSILQKLFSNCAFVDHSKDINSNWL